MIRLFVRHPVSDFAHWRQACDGLIRTPEPRAFFSTVSFSNHGVMP